MALDFYMGQAESAPPVVEVNYEELTYELLLEESKEDDFTVNTRKPDTFIQRIFTDLFGSLFLYMGTYVICDFMKTVKTGKWSRLVWAFLGPWNALTGMPLIHKLAQVKEDRPVKKCDRDYYEAATKCAFTNLPWDADDCIAQAEAERTRCIKNTDKYDECLDTVAAVNEYFQKYPPGSKGIDLPPGVGFPNIGHLTEEEMQDVCVNAVE